MKRTIKISFLAFVFTVSVFAQTQKPKIALYIAGDELTDAQKQVLETKVLRPFTESGIYDVIDRSDVFRDKVTRERKKQTDGSVNDNDICKLGVEAGARFVVMAALINAFGTSYNISARLVDVETAKISGVGETDINGLDDISGGADEVFRQIHGGAKAKNVQSQPSENVISQTARKEPSAASGALGNQKLRSAPEYNMRGETRYNNGEFDKAVSDFTEAVARFPREVLYRANRAAAFYANKEYDNAIADFSDAIQLDSRSVRLRVGRADAHYAKGNYSAAAADYEFVLKLDANNAKAKSMLEEIGGNKSSNQGVQLSASGGGDASFTDFRDKSTYKIKRVGGYDWFLRDLSYDGGKYSYYEAKTACPRGWRLPNNSEWENLKSEASAEDISEFTNGSKCNKWWSSEETVGSGGHGWSVNKKGSLSKSAFNNKEGSRFCVRCIQN